MTPISTNRIDFHTPVGNVTVVEHEDGGWVFEFTSGWNNGLHCAVPFSSFDKCYTHIKSRITDWKKEIKREQGSNV